MRSIELFAGAGVLALATANAGFHHDAVLEWDQNACDTIRRNKAAGLLGGLPVQVRGSTLQPLTGGG